MVDFSIIEGDIIYDQEADLIMQQIEILLDTRNGEVLGDYKFGTRFDVYLYNPNIGNTTIENDVRNYIIGNVELFDWQVDVHAEFLAGSLNDILLLTIELHDPSGSSYHKTYKVTQGAVEY